MWLVLVCVKKMMYDHLIHLNIGNELLQLLESDTAGPQNHWRAAIIRNKKEEGLETLQSDKQLKEMLISCNKIKEVLLLCVPPCAYHIYY